MQLSNPRHEAFCQAYAANHEHHYQAYLSVYPFSSKKAAYVSAARLLRLDKIKIRVSQILSEKALELPLIELVARSLKQSLTAKKVIRIKGGYIEVPHYAVQLRAFSMACRYQDKGLL